MQSLNTQSSTYNDTVVRQFSIMAVVWGVVGMLVGVVIAAQLVWPELNLGLPWTSFGQTSCAAIITPTNMPTTPQTTAMMENCRTTVSL